MQTLKISVFLCLQREWGFFGWYPDAYFYEFRTKIFSFYFSVGIARLHCLQPIESFSAIVMQKIWKYGCFRVRLITFSFLVVFYFVLDGYRGTRGMRKVEEGYWGPEREEGGMNKMVTKRALNYLTRNMVYVEAFIGLVAWCMLFFVSNVFY